jgi:hypothetical protein
MSRHATLDELARLGADDLRPRKAAKVGRHLASCTQCTQLSNELTGVSTLLASAQFPAMPDTLSTRLDSALAAEAAQRVAAEPATEAGRRDLPVRRPEAGRARLPAGRLGTDRTGQRAWWMPVPATRVLATAAAIVLVGAGGYVIASRTGGSGSSSATAAGGAAVPTPLGSQVSVGTRVTYRQDKSTESIQTVTAQTDYKPATLAGQAAAALSEARIDGVHASPVNGVSSAYNGLATPTASSGSLGFGSSSSLAGSQLAGCIDRVIPTGQVVLLVEHARFDGSPATIIVTSPASASGLSAPKEAQIWAVGQSCSASKGDVLDHVKVARL